MANNTFKERLEKYGDELRELYLGLYDDEQAYDYFLGLLKKHILQERHLCAGEILPALKIRRGSFPRKCWA